MPELSQPELPVARVAVDIPLSHLDRPFDYQVTAEQDSDAVPGARVRVRFAGRLRDGFILDRVATADHEGALAPLSKIVSSEPVLTPEIARLIRKVADHYAGTFADVVRLAIPPRHAATELAQRVTTGRQLPADHPAGPLVDYPLGRGFLAALRAGSQPRAMWQVTPSAAPSGDWALGLATAARACVESGRGAVIIVPDQADLDRLSEACTRVLGAGGFAVLVAEAGPVARYRAFLSASRGDVQVVIGNRAAAYAPVRDLGLVALWDDGDDLLAEQRAPYPHARDVLAMRAHDGQAAVLFASYARTAELQAWLERGWLRELADDRVVVRHAAPRVKVTADSDFALERDPAARAARLPHEVFEMVRATLPQGPVLVQVPRAGYLVALLCQECREPARCGFCGGPTRVPAGAPQEAASGRMSCAWCGRPQTNWECPICGSHHVRAPIIGAERTAEELGRAFPQTPVRQSIGGNRIAAVPDTSGIVVATPGAEPPATGGYAGAVLLDTPLLLLRQDLRAAEEALRRWLNLVALVRSGADDGSVIAVGESSGRALQALVRVDPAGFAARELAERAAARFPPAVKLITIEGPAEALSDFASLVHAPSAAQSLGPADLVVRRPAAHNASESTMQRLILRAPLAEGAHLVGAVKEVAAVRSARKSEGPLRIRVDPVELS
ncbi:MAG TPA: primosomal protein N' [Propionibacteriaceae bacterium]|nr:primosomal protein N' [Propionibacteriaceae bacterium]